MKKKIKWNEKSTHNGDKKKWRWEDRRIEKALNETTLWPAIVNVCPFRLAKSSFSVTRLAESRRRRRRRRRSKWWKWRRVNNNTTLETTVQLPVERATAVV